MSSVTDSDIDMEERSTKGDESNSHGGELLRKFELPTIANNTINGSIQVEMLALLGN